MEQGASTNILSKFISGEDLRTWLASSFWVLTLSASQDVVHFDKSKLAIIEVKRRHMSTVKYEAICTVLPPGAAQAIQDFFLTWIPVGATSWLVSSWMVNKPSLK